MRTYWPFIWNISIKCRWCANISFNGFILLNIYYCVILTKNHPNIGFYCNIYILYSNEFNIIQVLGQYKSNIIAILLGVLYIFFSSEIIFINSNELNCSSKYLKNDVEIMCLRVRQFKFFMLNIPLPFYLENPRLFRSHRITIFCSYWYICIAECGVQWQLKIFLLKYIRTERKYLLFKQWDFFL